MNYELCIMNYELCIMNYALCIMNYELLFNSPLIQSLTVFSGIGEMFIV